MREGISFHLDVGGRVGLEVTGQCITIRWRPLLRGLDESTDREMIWYHMSTIKQRNSGRQAAKGMWNTDPHVMQKFHKCVDTVSEHSNLLSGALANETPIISKHRRRTIMFFCKKHIHRQKLNTIYYLYTCFNDLAPLFSCQFHTFCIGCTRSEKPAAHNFLEIFRRIYGYAVAFAHCV
jgi:hypothetical protein